MKPYGLSKHEIAFCYCCNKYPVGRNGPSRQRSRKLNKRLPHKRARAMQKRELANL